MKALAAFIMRGRPQAVGVVALCAALALVLPPFTGPLAYLSAAGVALVVLHAGTAQGLLILVAAGAALALLGLLLPVGPLLGVVYAALIWLPVMGLAVVLRATGSLALTLGSAALLGALFASGVHLWSGDPVGVWRAALEGGLRPALEQMATGREPAQLDRLLDEMALVMTALLAISLVVSSCLSLFVARWWQALLYNAGGFQREFHALRLERVFVLPALVLLAAGMMAQGGLRQWLLELVAVVAVVYMFQGLAFVHRTVAARNAHTGWLVAMYGLLVLMLPQMGAALAVAGLLYSAGLMGAGSNDKPTPV